MSTYAKERRIAEAAVERAGMLTARVQKSLVDGKGTFTKSDESPVTIADLGAQALVIAAISHVFPGDYIVAEEDSQLLRESDSRRRLLWEHIKSVLEDTKEEGDLSAGVIGAIADEEEMVDLIDRGGHEGGKIGRIWALDPVDGTKGFLRGEQYAVCLGLMVNGQVVVGAINCPNLPIDPKNPDAGCGIVFSAERHQGSTMRPTNSNQPDNHNPIITTTTPITMNKLTPTTLPLASFCEGVESAHSAHSTQAQIAQKLGIQKPPVRMDSQAKYATVARGHADIYLRLPRDNTYVEKIWDHVAGSLIVEEAGGKVSDIFGKELDFGLGRTLKENKGVIVAHRDVHERVIEVVGEVVQAAQKGAV